LRYDIELVEDAKEDIRALHADHRAQILDALPRHLANRPDIEEGHKKYLGTLGTWQLSVGGYRVWYDVVGKAVVITVVFYKGRLPTAEALVRRRKQ
jgi:mRNA-degrading endonuclease RelE of RelBE toxin-antitoxin system